MDDCKDYPQPDVFTFHRRPSPPSTVWLSGRLQFQKDRVEHLPVQFESVAASNCEPVCSRAVADASPSAGPSVSSFEKGHDLAATTTTTTAATAACNRLHQGGNLDDLPDSCNHNRQRSSGCPFSFQGRASRPPQGAAPSHSPLRSYPQEQEQDQRVTCTCKLHNAGCVAAGTPGADGAVEVGFNSTYTTACERVQQQSRHSNNLLPGAGCWPQQSCYSARNSSMLNGSSSPCTRCPGEGNNRNNKTEESGSWCTEKFAGEVSDPDSIPTSQGPETLCASQLYELPQSGNGSQHRNCSRTRKSPHDSPTSRLIQQPPVVYRDLFAPVCRASATANSPQACNTDNCFVQENDDSSCGDEVETCCPNHRSRTPSLLPPSHRRPGSAAHHHQRPPQGSAAPFSPQYVVSPTCRSRTATVAETAASAATAARAAAARAQCAAEAAVEARKEAEALAARAQLEEKASTDAPPGTGGAASKTNMYRRAWPYRTSLHAAGVTRTSPCSHGGQQIKPSVDPFELEQNNLERSSACTSSNSSSMENSCSSHFDSTPLGHQAQPPTFSPRDLTSCTPRRTRRSKRETGTSAGPTATPTPPATTHSGGTATKEVTAAENEDFWIPWNTHTRGSPQRTNMAPTAPVPVTSLDPWTSPSTPTNLYFSSSPPLTEATPWGWDEALTAVAAASSPSCSSTAIAASSTSSHMTPLWRRMQQDSLARRVAAAETAAIERQRRASTGNKRAWMSLLQATRGDNAIKGSCPLNRRSKLLYAMQLRQQKNNYCSQPLSSLAIATLHAQQNNMCRGSCNPACRAVATAAERVSQRRKQGGGTSSQVAEGSRSRKLRDAANRSPIATAAAAVAQAVSAATAPVEKALDTAELFEALGLDADGRPKEGFAPLAAAGKTGTEAAPTTGKGERDRPQSSSRMTSAHFQRLTRSSNASTGGAAPPCSTKNKCNANFYRTYSSSDSISSSASLCHSPVGGGAPGHRCVATTAVENCLPSLDNCYMSALGRGGRRYGPNDIVCPGEENHQCMGGRSTGATRRSQSACTTRCNNKASPVAAAAAAAAAVLAAANALVESATSAAAAATDSEPVGRGTRQFSYSSARLRKAQREGEARNNATAAAVASLRAAKKAAATASAALDTLQQQAEEQAEREGLLQQDLLCEGCFSWMDDEEASYCDGVFEEHCCAAAAAQRVQARASAALAAMNRSSLSKQECEEEGGGSEDQKKQEKGKNPRRSERDSELIAPSSQEAMEEEGSETSTTAKKKEKKHKSRKSDASTIKDGSASDEAGFCRSERRKHSKRSTVAEQDASASSKKELNPRHSKVKKAIKSKEGDEGSASVVQSRASSLKHSGSYNAEKRAPKHASIFLDQESGGSGKESKVEELSASGPEVMTSSFEVEKVDYKEEQKECEELRRKDSSKKRGSRKEKKKGRQSSASDNGEGGDRHLEAESSTVLAREEATTKDSEDAEGAREGDPRTVDGEAAKAAAELLRGDTSDFPEAEVAEDASGKHSRKRESRRKKDSQRESVPSSAEEEEGDKGNGEESSKKGKTSKKKHSTSSTTSRERKSSKKKDGDSRSSSRKNTAISQDGEGKPEEENDGAPVESEKVKEKKKKKKKSVEAHDYQEEEKLEKGEGMEDSQVSKPEGKQTRKAHHSNRSSDIADAVIDVQNADNQMDTSKTDVFEFRSSSCTGGAVNSSPTNGGDTSSSTHLADVSSNDTQSSAAAVDTCAAVASSPDIIDPAHDPTADVAAADVAAADCACSFEKETEAGGEKSTSRGHTVEQSGFPHEEPPECSAAAAAAILGLPEQQREQQKRSSSTEPPLPSTDSPKQLTPAKEKEANENQGKQPQAGSAAAEPQPEYAVLRGGG